MILAGPPGRAGAPARSRRLHLNAIYFTELFPPANNPNELSRFEAVVAFVDQTFAIDGTSGSTETMRTSPPTAGATEQGAGADLRRHPGVPAPEVLPAAAEGFLAPIFFLMRILTVSWFRSSGSPVFAPRLPRAIPDASGAVTSRLPGSPFCSTGDASFPTPDGVSSSSREAALRRGVSCRAGAKMLLAGFLEPAAISGVHRAPVVLFSRCASCRDGGSAACLVLPGAVRFGAPPPGQRRALGLPVASPRTRARRNSRRGGSGLFGVGPPSPGHGVLPVRPVAGLVLLSPSLWAVPGSCRGGERQAPGGLRVRRRLGRRLSWSFPATNNGGGFCTRRDTSSR
jgi:hypothetical protein